MANHNPMVKMLDDVDKEKFFKDLMRELESDDWKNTKRKLEEIIIKTYMEYDNLTSYEDFMGKQSEIKVLKKIVYMDRYKNWGGQISLGHPLHPTSRKLGSC